MITVGSLFSGIGGLELGLERAGMQVVWQVEKDPFCRQVLAKHWPNVTRFEDVKDVGVGSLAPVDLICGGFPCQDISLAGKRAGIKGARSGLWKEFRRIIEEVYPSYALIENVSALRSSGLDVVLKDLVALGYDAEWHCIPASYVGAPHRRDRIWILAYPNCPRLPFGILQSRSEGGQGVAPERQVAGLARAMADADDERRNGRTGYLAKTNWRHEPANSGDDVADPDGAAREGRSDPATLFEGRRSASAERENVRREGELCADDARSCDTVVADSEGERCGEARELRPIQSEEWTGGRGAPSGPEWWSVEPDVGRVAHGVPARVDRLRALGNAVVPQVAEFIGRQIVAAHAESEANAA